MTDKLSHVVTVEFLAVCPGCGTDNSEQAKERFVDKPFRDIIAIGATSEAMLCKECRKPFEFFVLVKEEKKNADL